MNANCFFSVTVSNFKHLSIPSLVSSTTDTNPCTGRAGIIEKFWGKDTGSMVAIEAELVRMGTTPTENLKPFHEKHPDIKLDVACYNGPNNYVVAGRTVDIEVLESYLKDRKLKGDKIRFKVLKGMYAYHSIMAESIIDESAKLSASIPFQVSIKYFSLMSLYLGGNGLIFLLN